MATAYTVTPTKACFPILSFHLHLHSCLMTQRLYNPHTCHFKLCNFYWCRSRWPCSLRKGSAATHLMRLLVGHGRVSFECCMSSGRGPCNTPISRPEESYQVCMCHWEWSSVTITSAPTINRLKRSRLRKRDKNKVYSYPYCCTVHFVESL